LGGCSAGPSGSSPDAASVIDACSKDTGKDGAGREDGGKGDSGPRDSASEAHDAASDDTGGHGTDAGLPTAAEIAAACAALGFPTTTVIDMAWDTPGSPDTVAYTSDYGSFQQRGALVVRFITPAVAVAPTHGFGLIGTVEFTGPPAHRSGALSTVPCDFTTGITGQPGLSSVFSTDEPTVYFTLGYMKSGDLQLQPSTAYYFNEVNYAPAIGGTLQCEPGPTCDEKVTLNKQPGT